MAIHAGLEASFSHEENGMSRSDMVATLVVANQLDEVIIFRSTGPWSMRWIERGYPTKNFHVKGKSSDWGPQAGFVPYNGLYSKVGDKPVKAAAGTAANDDGLKHHFAGKVQLTLTFDEIMEQVNRAEESPPRLAIHKYDFVPNTSHRDYFLYGRRSGDNKEFAFRATLDRPSTYKIAVYTEKMGTDPKRLIFETPEPLEVMTSSEAGANNKPMTGDYDLMCVCPRWGNLNSRSIKEISKPGLVFTGKGEQPGLTFAAGTNLDKVLDMRSNTGALPKGGDRNQTYGGLTKKDGGKLDEHGDMGNLTPRFLRCINALNSAMAAVGPKSPFRRVHHNAESHRNHIFAALTKVEMESGDGLPLTAFQPDFLLTGAKATARYGNVATMETLAEFRDYATALNQEGYFVPRNWTWGMSIRDGFR